MLQFPGPLGHGAKGGVYVSGFTNSGFYFALFILLIFPPGRSTVPKEIVQDSGTVQVNFFSSI